jgi:hypothetical protein
MHRRNYGPARPSLFRSYAANIATAASAARGLETIARYAGRATSSVATLFSPSFQRQLIKGRATEKAPPTDYFQAKRAPYAAGLNSSFLKAQARLNGAWTAPRRRLKPARRLKRSGAFASRYKTTTRRAAYTSSRRSRNASLRHKKKGLQRFRARK